LILGRVEAAAGRYIVAPSTDRLNARWFLLLAVLLSGSLGSASTGVGGSFSGEELFYVLILHHFAHEVLVVALEELPLGRIQAARHVRDGRIAGLTNHADAFGRLLLFVLIVFVSFDIVLFIAFNRIDSFDIPATDVVASIDSINTTGIDSDLRFNGR